MNDLPRDPRTGAPLNELSPRRADEIRKLAEERAYVEALLPVLPQVIAQNQKLINLMDDILLRAADGPLCSEDLQLLRIIEPARQKMLNRLYGKEVAREQIDARSVHVDAAALVREGRASALDAAKLRRLEAGAREAARMAEVDAIDVVEVVEDE